MATNNSKNNSKANGSANNNGSKNKIKNNKKPKTWTPSHQPLEPIRLGHLQSAMRNDFNNRYQLDWAAEEYEIVELYTPISWSAYEVWIKNGSSFMIEQVKIASTFADMKMDKIRIEDLQLAQQVIFDGAKALMPTTLP